MEAKSTTMGSSLVVPLIQELAKNTPTIVPSRFTVNDEDHVPLISSSEQVLIPVIDMQKLLSGDFMDSELGKLDHACREWGFFQLVNHGVSSSLVEKVKVEIQEFFNLPMKEKEKFWMRPGETEGFGQNFVVSEEQRLDWAYGFTMFTLPTYLRKPHLFPKLPLPLRDTLEAWSAELGNLSQKLLHQMAKALGIDANDVKALFEEAMQTMRMNYYPPCPKPEQVIGFNSHSDASSITILLQLNETVGLQIKKDGMWVPVIPLPDAFIINVGDILEVILCYFL
ncbi:hypothetical protein CISIN_1g023533mg [Citrus sinensis]|uniref:Fe2OG dioxygenase domain-containing protein n=1 Tax=Citrus sinensis TaxID=2711 RepID=A0A067EFV4_CITSI|nr:hypothetical protein CISIN_1g023533mg [Citrus sinensis]